MLSIHSRHARRIYVGTKKYEYRRGFRRLFAGDGLLFYEVRPRGIVTGQALVADVQYLSADCAVESETDLAARFHLAAYLAGATVVSRIELTEVCKWRTPRELTDFGFARAPQSYAFLDESTRSTWDTSRS